MIVRAGVWSVVIAMESPSGTPIAVRPFDSALISRRPSLGRMPSGPCTGRDGFSSVMFVTVPSLARSRRSILPAYTVLTKSLS